jgi:hypothetical protein
MSVFAQPKTYSEMLAKIAIFTGVTAFLLTLLIGWHSPTAARMLDALNIEVKVWIFEKVKLGWVLPAFLVALAARIIKLHDRISDAFRVRETFDLLEILVPIAGGVQIPVDADLLGKLREKRDQVLREVFYKYASSLSPKIDGQLVISALDKWTWFWILLESVVLGFVTTVVLVLLAAYEAAAFLGLGVLAGILLFRQAGPLCAPTAHAEVNAILQLPDAPSAIQAYLYKL